MESLSEQESGHQSLPPAQDLGGSEVQQDKRSTLA